MPYLTRSSLLLLCESYASIRFITKAIYPENCANEKNKASRYVPFLGILKIAFFARWKTIFVQSRMSWGHNFNASFSINSIPCNWERWILLWTYLTGCSWLVSIFFNRSCNNSSTVDALPCISGSLLKSRHCSSSLLGIMPSSAHEKVSQWYRTVQGMFPSEMCIPRFALRLFEG